MDNPVTFSDITLLNTLATCANMTTDEVFKDFKIMANKKILENHKYEIYYSESEKSWHKKHIHHQYISLIFNNSKTTRLLLKLI